ncbi:unnamed protein product [Lepeophtheirus salmonis]|uniref:(salmon louse) hypothetical protein n=1 Tax=Lepeophtheirus salmonis TaxID=72036 RepID=A0A7R8CHC2_LEPSM|nr:unnamed protein product [Lepeophtheirus salmonis]CAF2822879.1 unnamed protein product [Lepeophtheirus salmonis]
MIKIVFACTLLASVLADNAPSHPTMLFLLHPTYHAVPSPAYHAPAVHHHEAPAHYDESPKPYPSNTESLMDTLTVTYTVDGYNGFVADVAYEGTPVYDEYVPQHKNHQQAGSYHVPTPSYKPAPVPAYKSAPAPAYKPAPASSSSSPLRTNLLQSHLTNLHQPLLIDQHLPHPTSQLLFQNTLKYLV